MIYLFGAATRWSYIGLGLTGTAAVFLLAKLLDKHANRKRTRVDWPRLTRHLPAQRICPGRDARRSG